MRSVVPLVVATLATLATTLSACAAAPAAEPDSRRCAPPDGVSGSPGTLTEVVALLDALPKPTTVECFVESLDRPLHVIGSTSAFSAQPAYEGSPRIFGIFGTLIASWVPAGVGSEVLEFAEERGRLTSVKAELHMPIERKITYDDFGHIFSDGGTVCAGCHPREEPVDDIEIGRFYASEALRPGTADTVRVQTMRDLHDYCDPAIDARRCNIYAAMFEHGEVVDSDFPRSLPTIYD